MIDEIYLIFELLNKENQIKLVEYAEKLKEKQ